jgi:uncharacterized OsmC-like protein
MQTLKTVLERNQRALELRPALGRISTSTCVRLNEGLVCEVEEGPWRLRVDMSEKSGGQGTAPNPGIYGRAALGSCLAIGYRMLFARHDIAIRSLQVEVQADFDARYEYGMLGRNPGYEQVRCLVAIESDAPTETVRTLIAEANESSSFLNVWQQAQDVRMQIQVNGD